MASKSIRILTISLLNISVNIAYYGLQTLLPEWHRKRYLKEALYKYLDDYVDNDIIVGDILDIICDRQERAHAEYHKLEDLELKLRE